MHATRRHPQRAPREASSERRLLHLSGLGVLNVEVRVTALHSTAVRVTALHSTAVRVTALHSTAMRVTALHSTAVRVTALHLTALATGTSVC